MEPFKPTHILEQGEIEIEVSFIKLCFDTQYCLVRFSNGEPHRVKFSELKPIYLNKPPKEKGRFWKLLERIGISIGTRIAEDELEKRVFKK